MPSRGPAGRAAALGALNRELRTMSSRTVMLSQAVASRLGISPTDLETLEILSSAGPLTAGRLAELTGLTSGAITGVVDRLEQRGFVRRERDAADRRRVIVHLVPERARKIDRLFQPLARAMDQLHERYSDEELALILDYVTQGNALAHQHTIRVDRATAARARG
jgi:DNA-binding MarR family transcriptional regulator